MSELEAWLWFEQVLETKKELEDLERFTTFATLRRQYEERLLLEELNQTDEGSEGKPGGLGDGNSSN